MPLQSTTSFVPQVDQSASDKNYIDNKNNTATINSLN